MRTTVNLPKIPRDPEDLEDCVGALFHASGYHVQRNVHHRDPDDVLELDSVAIDYGATPPRRVLAEAKSGGWGYGDAFKVVGWMTYLGIPEAALFVSRIPEGRDLASMDERVRQLSLRIVHLGDGNKLIKPFIEAGFAKRVDRIAFDAWRYVYGIERGMMKYLTQRARSDPSKKGPQVLLEYYRLINDKLFFEPDVHARLEGLYNAHQSHPKLMLGIARELGGGQFDCEGEDPSNAFVREAIYEGKHDLLQVCLYLQHRARLAVLQSAVDLVCYKPKPKILVLGGRRWKVLRSLPASFQAGLDALSRHSAFRQYPLFWQVFLWACGGFYLRDREKDEFAWLSALTGVPVKEVPSALTVFDTLFPIKGSWLKDAYNSQCRVVMLVPTPMQGIGAYHRRRRHGLEDFEGLGYGDFTTRDLIKWNNAGVAWLARHSHLKASGGS